jgi:protein phosphatase
MTVTHVGDSRAYTIKPGGQMAALTRDHSLVKRLIELGRISTDEAAVHPQRNVLYRALGQGEQYDPDINTMQLPETGYLLLCSDGLWGVVPDEELYRLVYDSASPEEACQKMVVAANDAGGPDNITAILVRLPG